MKSNCDYWVSEGANKKISTNTRRYEIVCYSSRTANNFIYKEKEKWIINASWRRIRGQIKNKYVMVRSLGIRANRVVKYNKYSISILLKISLFQCEIKFRKSEESLVPVRPVMKAT